MTLLPRSTHHRPRPTSPTNLPLSRPAPSRLPATTRPRTGSPRARLPVPSHRAPCLPRRPHPRHPAPTAIPTTPPDATRHLPARSDFPCQPLPPRPWTALVRLPTPPRSTSTRVHPARLPRPAPFAALADATAHACPAHADYPCRPCPSLRRLPTPARVLAYPSRQPEPIPQLSTPRDSPPQPSAVLRAPRPTSRVIPSRPSRIPARLPNPSPCRRTPSRLLPDYPCRPRRRPFLSDCPCHHVSSRLDSTSHPGSPRHFSPQLDCPARAIPELSIPTTQGA